MTDDKSNLIPESRPRHAPPKGRVTQEQELLYDPNVAAPSHSEEAKTLAEKMGTATLCTISTNPEGYPYGSFVTYIIHEGDPIFLISVLAEHTKNLHQSSKSSLLIAEAGLGNPLALGRVTLVGECKKISEDDYDVIKKSFLLKHEGAKHYVDYKDFSFYRLKVQSIRYIGGFGRMSWIDSDDWYESEADPISYDSKDIISHMNEDHKDAMIVMCKSLSLATDTSDAEMTGVDRYGFEMSAITENGPRPIRLAFDEEAITSDDVRKQMVKMVKIARERLTSTSDSD